VAGLATLLNEIKALRVRFWRRREGKERLMER